MKTAKNSAAEAYDALLSFKFRVTGAIKIIPTIFWDGRKVTVA